MRLGGVGLLCRIVGHVIVGHVVVSHITAGLVADRGTYTRAVTGGGGTRRSTAPTLIQYANNLGKRRSRPPPRRAGETAM